MSEFLNERWPPPDEPTLHAYVDGELTPEDAARVATWLQAHPAEAQRVLAWQAQRRQLQALRRDLLDEPLPPRLLQAWAVGAAAPADDAERPAPRTAQPQNLPTRRGGLAANGPWRAVAALMIGLGLGWSLRPWLAPAAGAASTESQAVAASVPTYVREAAAAHALYVPERRHPVEVGAEQQEHLVQWLGKRLGTPLRVPHLEGLGYHLVGGRLLPGGTGAASAAPAEAGLARAQFMYENGEGERLTLYVAMATPPANGPAASGASATTAITPTNRTDEPAAAFRFTASGSGAALRHSFYWQDGALRYALTGGADRARLAAVAEQVSRELAPP
jgi:anti-sigma factor RsiW